MNDTPLIVGIAGISGTGKTTIVQELSKIEKVNRISSTKILMKLCNIIEDISQEPTDANYLSLEKQSPKLKEDLVGNEKFIKLMYSQCKKDYINVYELHFVSPQRGSSEIHYQLIPIYNWYFSTLSGICYVTSSTKSVVLQKRDDANRMRGILTEDSTAIQKYIADLQWEKLISIAPESFPLLELRNMYGRLESTIAQFRSWTLSIKYGNSN